MKKNNKNILRISRKDVLDNFIISFYANERSLSSYVKATLPQQWMNFTKDKSIEKITSSDYEETLINYFKSPMCDNSHPLLVIVGGVGTGKSSSIRYALKESNVCDNCCYFKECSKDYPSRIIVDFIKFRTTVVTATPEEIKKITSKDEIDDFWYHILQILDIVLDNEMDEKTEISPFWYWLINDQKTLIPIKLYRYLFPKRKKMLNLKDNSGELFKLKDTLFKKLTTKELTYYKLFQIAFLRRESEANCNFIIFDNIDTLAPYLQAEVVNFSLEAYRLINCKTIIPLRPHTLTTNKDASDFFEIIEHWKPSLIKVFKKRLDNYKTNGDKDVYQSLSMLIDTIQESRIFKEVFIATSAKSVRYALRNFYNLCLSPLIVTHQDNRLVSSIDLDLNTFFQAYFCTELENQTLDNENFQNIISIKKSVNHSYSSNIKLRFLHLVYTNNYIRLGKIYKILRAFNYQNYEITSVLNEFIDPKKSLVWSSTLSQYSKSELKNGKDHILQITHLGVKYFDLLLTQPFFFRECFCDIAKSRTFGKQNNINQVLSGLKALEYIDYEEIEIFISNMGLEKYREIYNDSDYSISHILWLKIRNNLSNWIKDDKFTDFDFQRQNFIQDSVKRITKI